MTTLVSENSKTGLSNSHSTFNGSWMPWELWRMVVDELPYLTGRHAAEAFGFELDERCQKHSAVWNEIFTCDEGWGLNFILIGDNLRDLIDNPKHPASIALLTGDRTRSIRADKARFLSSLKEHHLNEERQVVFHESNIVLNIDDVLYRMFFIILAPRHLFSCDEDGLPRSAYLYWQNGEFTLREISAKDIVGKGGQASTLEGVSFICGITLTHPRDMSLRHRHQYLFQHPDCPLAYTHLPHGCNYNRHNILGWELGDDLIFEMYDLQNAIVIIKANCKIQHSASTTCCSPWSSSTSHSDCPIDILHLSSYQSAANLGEFGRSNDEVVVRGITG